MLVLTPPVRAASVDGVNIHFSVTGTESKTVILVHGYTCDETTWTEQVPALARQYRVVTLDLPGHGKSGSPKDGRFSMDLFARAIEAVRVEVKAQRVVAVGHSMGTPVVLRYAHLYPEHVSALVLVDGLMPLPLTQAAARANQGATMGGPNGRATREAMIRRFFVAGTTAEVQTKVLKYDVGGSGGDGGGRDERHARACGPDNRNPDGPDPGALRGFFRHRQRGGGTRGFSVRRIHFDSGDGSFPDA